MPAFTPIQQEAVILAAALDMIDDMVNLGRFEAPITRRPTNLLFKDGAEKRIFAILLGDFLAQPQPRGKRPPPFRLQLGGLDPRGSERTFLPYLAAVAASPKIATETAELAQVVSDFAAWLDTDLTCPKVWLSGLEIEFDMTISRVWLLQTVPDMCKHNFARLEGRIHQIRSMLADHGHEVDEGDLYLELPVFEEWLFDHLFSYHASTIAEFLNNIRWAIYGYLRPEFVRAFRRLDEDIRYTFDAPPGLEAGMAHGMYWRLMNAMRTPPYFPRFEVTEHLKAEF
jgi:hypothetical protein